MDQFQDDEAALGARCVSGDASAVGVIFDRHHGRHGLASSEGTHPPAQPESSSPSDASARAPSPSSAAPGSPAASRTFSPSATRSPGDSPALKKHSLGRNPMPGSCTRWTSMSQTARPLSARLRSGLSRRAQESTRRAGTPRTVPPRELRRLPRQTAEPHLICSAPAEPWLFRRAPQVP